MAKRIKLPGRAESAEVGGVVAGANAIYDDAKGKMQDVVNGEVDAELVRLEESKQDNLTFDNAPTEGSQNPVTSAGVYTADKALSDAIEAILLLIPSAASALNQLADKKFVQDSVATSTATFRGTYNVVSDLHLSANASHAQIEAALDALSLGADTNDYCFVQVPDNESTENIKKTERYKFNGTTWAYEYDLNNSGFTAAQWEAINSNITALLVTKLSQLPTNEVLTALLAVKQDSLTFDDEPTAGSNNPVTSGGIYARNNEIVAMITALEAAKQDNLTFDSVPVNGSENPVMSGGVYNAIYLVQVALAGLDGRMLSAEHSIEVLTENVGILRTLYQALSQSDIIVGAKPTTGVANIIYRVPGSSTFADWMYYNGAWVKLAEYTTLDGYLYKGIATPNGSPAASAVKMFYFALTPGTYTNFGNLVVKYGINILKYDGANWTLENLGNSDGVFDVTEYSGSSFASLEALLSDENLSNLIPVGVRKGGMSIKFVHSVDHKYVQYMLNAQTWTVNVGYWEKINLADKVDGEVILSYSGIQGFQQINEIQKESLATIELSGGLENLKEIRFLRNEQGVYKTLKTISPDERAQIITTIPANCNYIGFYEVTGTTLDFSVIVRINSLWDRMSVTEDNLIVFESLYNSNQKGLSVEGELSPAEKIFYSAIKSIGYYDPQSTSPVYIRQLGFFTTFIQMVLTSDKTSMLNFREDATVSPTGVKTYHLFNGKKELIFTVDWDIYNSNYLNNTNYRFGINNNSFANIIAPLNENIQEQIDEINDDVIIGTTEEIGYSESTSEQAVANTVVCPVKRVSKDGKIESIYLKSQNAGKVVIYVGEVDQLYLFIARESYEIDVVAGAQTIDVSNLNIYVFAGEQVALQYNGNRYYKITDGTPEEDASFYYGSINSGLQLAAYGINNKKIQFAFKYVVRESELISLKVSITRNSKEIRALSSEIGYIQSNLNIVSDISGNKYRMMVVNGDVRAFSLNFSHIMAVGNSYTIHPTTVDTGDLATSLWWGHWAMAASRKETAWTTLLQTAIRQKNNTAKVTPVFGRRYETGLKTLSDNDAFIYWENDQWKNLKPNVTEFSDVDCVLFFLGDNYTVGSGWYEKYKPMVLQFMSWFPNATIVCCSCRIRQANNEAIAQVASEVSAVYISMYGLGGASKLGNFVSGDDGNLHQIDSVAVAGHFGDYGEWLILDKIVNAIGYDNNANLYNISITNPTGVSLSVKDSQTLEGAIVSVFADISDGASLSGITVTSGGNAITVTDHGNTEYGRIFTFQMPAGDVSVVGT